MTSAPAARSGAARAGSSSEHRIRALPGGARMRAVGGVRSLESSTTRSGWRTVPGRRTSSRGSSARTVPLPVITADERARRRCTSVAGRLAGDPLALAARQGRRAVEAGGELDAHPGPAARHARHEPGVELARLALEHAALDRDAGRGEARDAAAVAPSGSGRASRRRRGRCRPRPARRRRAACGRGASRVRASRRPSRRAPPRRPRPARRPPRAARPRAGASPRRRRARPGRARSRRADSGPSCRGPGARARARAPCGPHRARDSRSSLAPRLARLGRQQRHLAGRTDRCACACRAARPPRGTSRRRGSGDRRRRSARRRLRRAGAAPP